MAIKKPTIAQQIMTWAGDRVAHTLWAGRLRKNPVRETDVYSRLMSVGGQRYMKDRPMIKPTPSNLRRFGRTPYARRAINRVKGAVAGLKWEVAPKPGVKENAEINRQIELVTMCLQRPNQDDSFRSMIEQVAEDYLSCGAGVIEHEVGSNPLRPLWLWPVDGLSIEIYAGWSGDRNEPRYAQTHGYGNVGGSRGIPLLNDQIIYIKKDPTTDNPFGLGCLEVAFNSISRLLSTQDYAGNVAGNAQPANMLQMVGMDSTTLDRFRVFWREEIEGQGMTPIIGGEEAKVHPLRGATDDALYLKYQEFLLREIATAFEINPGNLGIEADVNRNTAEVGEDRDWQGAIIPCASNIASYLNREAIEGKLGFSQIEFRWLGIDRDDEEMLAGIHEKYFKNNVLKPNEIREKLGRPPLESKWGELLAVDMEIAKQAARSVGEDLDPDLQPGSSGKAGRTIKDPDAKSNPSKGKGSK